MKQSFYLLMLSFCARLTYLCISIFFIAGCGGGQTTSTNSIVIVPDAPTMVAAIPGNGQATVSFTPPASTGGAVITGYTVSCDNGASSAVTSFTNSSPITVNGLTNGTAYSCSVTATNTAGRSKASSLLKVTPLDPFNGFLVDLSALTEEQKVISAAEIIKQIQVIQNANLPAAMYAFMKTIPIVVDPSLPTDASPALFDTTGGTDKGSVKCYTGLMPSEKPVMLHEMLHAYDWNNWKFNNTTIIQAYRKAMEQNFYPSASGTHFLKDAREFFAMSGTIYLVGNIQQPPYNCTQLALHQPIYIKFLESQFGTHAYCNSN